MRRSMLDILACPVDKAHPLEMYEAAARGDEVSEGALYCAECSRFFPIMQGIPVMLPDELRDRGEEKEFLKRHRDILPGKVIKKARPWHL